jgi:hypothetical protein
VFLNSFLYVHLPFDSVVLISASVCVFQAVTCMSRRAAGEAALDVYLLACADGLAWLSLIVHAGFPFTCL